MERGIWEEGVKREQMLAQWSLASPRPWGITLPSPQHVILFSTTHTHTHMCVQTQPCSLKLHLQMGVSFPCFHSYSHAPPTANLDPLPTVYLTHRRVPGALKVFTASVQHSTLIHRLCGTRLTCANIATQTFHLVSSLHCHHRLIAARWQQIEIHSKGREPVCIHNQSCTL